MSNKRAAMDLSMLSHMPFSSQWLLQLSAFQSSDARLVRGALNLLFSAFQATPCGTIPYTIEAIATASHLTPDEVKQNLTTLTQGWKLNPKKTVMQFEPLAKLARRFDSDFGDALTSLQDRAVAAISSPDLAADELMAYQGAELADKLGGSTIEKANEIPDTKVMRGLPKDAIMTESMKTFTLSKGFSEASLKLIWETFYHFQRSEGRTSKSWESAFKTWLNNQLRYGKFTPDATDEMPKIYESAGSANLVSARSAARRPFKSTLNTGPSAPAPARVNFKTAQSQQLESNAMNNLRLARQNIDARQKETIKEHV